MDPTDLIAANLGHLPHPNGDILQFIQYAQLPGTPDDQADQARTINRIVAAAIVNLLAINGYTITKTGQPHA